MVLNRRPSRILALVVAFLTLTAGLLVSGPAAVTSSVASAETSTSSLAGLNLAITPTSLANLSDGSTVTFSLTATSPQQVLAVQARLCKGSASIDYSADFNPTAGGNCIATPFSGSTALSASTTVLGVSPYTSASITYAVGAGTQTFTKQDSSSTTIECGPTATLCKIVLKVSISTGDIFVGYPVYFVGQATQPDAPTAVFAIAPSSNSAGRAEVHWTPPTNTGSLAIDHHTATAYLTDGTSTGLDCVTQNSSDDNCTISGLTDGTPYVFKVTTTNAAPLESNPSADSPAFIPGGAKFTAITPVRALDTRNGTGQGGTAARVGSSTQGSSNSDASAISLQIRGANGIPNDATAVVMNVTATGLTSPAGSPQSSYLTVWPGNTSTAPTASNLNFNVGQSVPNLVTVGIGTNGSVKIYNKRGAVNVIADIVGYYAPDTGDGLTAISPVRALDTRNGTGQGGTAAKVGDQAQGSSNSDASALSLQIQGANGIPLDATAVVMNVTATGLTSPAGSPQSSYLTVWPGDTATAPTASNLNFNGGQSVANLVTVGIGTNGSVKIYNKRGAVNVIADIVGYYSPDVDGARFFAMSPIRTLDTRDGTGGNLARVGEGGSPNVSGAYIDLTVAGRTTVPSVGVDSVVMNVTATGWLAVSGQPASSFLTVWPTGPTTPPTASNINFAAGQSIPNLVVCKIGAGGQVSIFNRRGAVNVIADVVGWFAD